MKMQNPHDVNNNLTVLIEGLKSLVKDLSQKQIDMLNTDQLNLTGQPSPVTGKPSGVGPQELQLILMTNQTSYEMIKLLTIIKNEGMLR